MFRTGIRTTEFWITLFATAGLFLAGVTNTVSPIYTIYLTTAAAVAYAASRAVQKYGSDLNKGYQTTEFWIGLISAGLVALQTVQDNLPNHTAAIAITVITAALTALRGFSKPNPLANSWHPALTVHNTVVPPPVDSVTGADVGDDAAVVTGTPPPFDQEAPSV